MAEGIKKSDLIGSDILDSIRLDLDAMTVSLEKNDKGYRDLAKTINSQLNPALEKTSKGIREITEAEIKSEKLFNAKIANEKKLIEVKVAQEKLTQAELRTKKTLLAEEAKIQKSRLQEIQTQKSREKAVDSFNKKEEQAYIKRAKISEKQRLDEIKLQQQENRHSIDMKLN